jgi:hypothetical protein
MKITTLTAILFAATATTATAENIIRPIGVVGKQWPQGETGQQGIAGTDGRNGIDGRDASSALAALQTRTPAVGQWTGAIALSGDEGGANGVSGGVRYGLSDTSDIYAVIGQSRDGTSWGVGLSWTFGQ